MLGIGVVFGQSQVTRTCAEVKRRCDSLVPFPKAKSLPRMEGNFAVEPTDYRSLKSHKTSFLSEKRPFYGFLLSFHGFYLSFMAFWPQS